MSNNSDKRICWWKFKESFQIPPDPEGFHGNEETERVFEDSPAPEHNDGDAIDHISIQIMMTMMAIVVIYLLFF